MNELELANRLIEEANSLIEQRDQKREDANVYRNVIRHDGDKTGLRASRMKRLQDDCRAIQEEIDYKLAFAENIIGRASA